MSLSLRSSFDRKECTRKFFIDNNRGWIKATGAVKCLVKIESVITSCVLGRQFPMFHHSENDLDDNSAISVEAVENL